MFRTYKFKKNKFDAKKAKSIFGYSILYLFLIFVHFLIDKIMITPDKKTKKKNILTAIAILAFMVFLIVFTLYNVGVFDRQI